MKKYKKLSIIVLLFICFFISGCKKTKMELHCDNYDGIIYKEEGFTPHYYDENNNEIRFSYDNCVTIEMD
jgi:hypothetical protein